MKLKVRTRTAAIIITVEETWPVQRVTELVLADPKLSGSFISSYSYGFPPKTVEADSEVSLKDAGIKPNEQLTAETSSNRAPVESATHKEDLNNKIAHVALSNSYLILRNVPDDNSCLFHAIAYALTGSLDYEDLHFRQIVADTIRQSPDFYSEVVLGRPVEDYCSWIVKAESWGGAIELGILSKYLGIRINCFDVELGSMMVFQDESAQALKYIVLVYSGIHYDCVVENAKLTESKAGDKGTWTGSEPQIVLGSEKLVKLLQSRNYTTNTTTFRVRCLDCYEVLVGESGAQKHANGYGHYRFGEVK